MMQRYNESVDTFSFALVLLCLAAGDIGYMRKQGSRIPRAAYAQGWRPPIPSELRFRCPDLASLISEMWDGDFRKRPALRDVVPRLEAASTAALDGVVPTTEEEEENSAQPSGGGSDKDAELAERDDTIRELEAEIAGKDARIRELEAEIAGKDARVRELEEENAE